MTLAELAARTGEPEAALRDLIEVGVLDDGAEFSVADVERVRLVQVLRRRGVEPKAVGAALAREQDAFDRYLAQLYPEGEYPSITLEDAAAATGIDLDLLHRVREAGGLGGPHDLITEGDVETMRAITVGLDAGFPEEALLQLVRVYADALNRVGEAESRLFHFYVHERLRASGIAADELASATAQSIEQVSGLVEPAVLYFHRRGLLRATREDLALHLAEDAGLLSPDDETGRLLAAVAFIDLARFTALTEVMGDATAAHILTRFADLVRRCALAHDGRIVKQIGDAFMLVFGDAGSAVEFALDIRDAALAEPQFLGTRQGIHWGPVLYREGDYYGATVNLAARIVAEAAADGVLVSGAVRCNVDASGRFEFTHAGQRRVKHVAQPIAVHDVTRPGDRTDSPRSTDPVCGMTVDASSSGPRLRFDDREIGFCSTTCLQRFAADPARYA